MFCLMVILKAKKYRLLSTPDCCHHFTKIIANVNFLPVTEFHVVTHIRYFVLDQLLRAHQQCIDNTDSTEHLRAFAIDSILTQLTDFFCLKLEEVLKFKIKFCHCQIKVKLLYNFRRRSCCYVVLVTCKTYTVSTITGHNRAATRTCDGIEHQRQLQHLQFPCVPTEYPGLRHWKRCEKYRVVEYREQII